MVRPQPRSNRTDPLLPDTTLCRLGRAASGATRVRRTRPNVGLIPTTALAALGRRIDPPVSVPIDPKPRPAATETADPLEDRPDQRCESQGLRGALKAG